jgi:glycosyltransferase involved in cell wall biosynthesis
MKITFVCPPDNSSGGARVVAIYASRLARRGHEVTVVMPRRRQPTLRVRARGLLKRGVWIRRRNDKESPFFWNVPFKVCRLDDPGPVMDRDLPDADVLIATWWETAEWIWAASKSKGAKVHFMQDYETWGAPGGHVSRVDAAIALPIPKIVIAEWVADLLERRWAQTPLALVSNSVDTQHFFAPPRGKQPIPTVGMVYSTMQHKGSDLVGAAVQRARQQLPELRIIAFGHNKPVPSIPLPPSTKFHFRVAEEELRRLYAACDAWLFGTRIEGFGLPILEAMACRTPVIGTPAGAAPALIGQGGGILVGMEDIVGMSKAILRISSMKESEWRAMSDAAFATANAYTWDDAMDQFEAAIVRVAHPG